MRQQLAQKAAQVLLESGTRDFHAAKQKAAQQLGVKDTQSLPNNFEIESALGEYQRLFRAVSQPEQLGQLREITIEAMRFLSQFKPRLVGSVLSGTADEHSVIRLHIFSEAIESVGFYLRDHQIPCELGERRLRLSTEQYQNCSTYEFLADDRQIELVVFLPKQKQIPLSPIDGKTMKRADITEVESLLSQKNK
jgi:hypothetical protein